MKIFKRVVIGFLIFIVVVSGLLVGALTWIYHHPEKTWEYARARFLPADLSVEWKAIDFDLHHVGDYWHWEFLWRATDLIVKKAEPKLVVPLDVVELRFGAVIGLKPKVTVHEVKGVSEKEILFVVPKSSTPTKSASPFETVRKYVGELDILNDWLDVEDLHLRARHLEVVNNGKPIVALVDIVKRGKIDTPIAITAESAHLVPGLKELRFTAQLQPRNLNSPRPFLAGSAHVAGENWEVDLTPELLLEKAGELGARVEAEALIKNRKPKAHARIKALLTQRTLAADAVIEARRLPGPLANVERATAHAEVPLDPTDTWGGGAGKLSVDAPLKLFFIDRNMRQPAEKLCKCKIPETVNARANAEFWARNYFAGPFQAEAQLADLRLRLEGLDNKLFTLDLGGRLQVARKGEGYVYGPSLDSSLVVHSAQGLIKFLDAKNILIPAPFDVLDGEVRVEARGPFVYSAEPKASFTTPVTLTTDIKSKTQVVKLTATTEVKADTRFTDIDVHVRALIEALQIELPPLEPIGGVPRMTRDSRIKSEPYQPPKKGARGKTHVKFTAEVATQKPGAVRLLSKLAKPWVPITIQAGQVIPPKSDGFVKVEPFAITYLRRTIQVENVTVNLRPVAKGVYPLKGRFRVDQTNYKVFIDVGGTTANPQYFLTSDPYLPQDDVISVLLFDQTTAELGTADAESKGNFQAALADRAIGLFGLWLFASTPIRSFNYNPVTKIYSASVQLGGGVTAAVGTDWDSSAQLELRKRLSRHWVVSASYAPGEHGTEVGQLVLQWEKRF